jgi:hypothetical protein
MTKGELFLIVLLCFGLGVGLAIVLAGILEIALQVAG